MDRIQTIKQDQANSSQSKEETLIMLNDKNQDLQEKIGVLETDNRKLSASLEELTQNLKVEYAFTK